VENRANEKGISLAFWSRTITSEGGCLTERLRCARTRNSEIETFGYHVPPRRRFCGCLPKERVAGRPIEKAKPAAFAAARC